MIPDPRLALETPRPSAASKAAASAPRSSRLPRSVRDALCILSLAVTDVAATFAAVALAVVLQGLLATWLPLQEMSVLDLVDAGQLLSIAVVTGFFVRGLYLRRDPFWENVRITLQALVVALTFALAALYLTHIAEAIPRSLATLSGLAILFIVPVARLLTLAALSRAGLWRRRVAVIGLPAQAQAAADDLQSDFVLGYSVEAIVPPDDEIPLKGFDETVIVATGLSPSAIESIVARTHREAGSVTLIPDFGPLPFVSGMTRFMFDRRRILLTTRNLLKDPANLFVKRSFDILGSLLLAALSLPLLALLALAVVLDSRGAPFYAQTRIGRNGKRFRCLKFRTMHADAEARLENILAADPPKRDEWERYQKLKEDPRITRVGRLLRRTSLDELPQIFNVIGGSMSLVGPRPLPQYHYEKFHEPYRTDYLEVTPGITGLWQVSGRADTDVERMGLLNSWYARNWSLWLDVTLLLRTIPAVLRWNGAY